MRIATLSLFVSLFLITGALANTPPVLQNCPANLTGSHCQVFSYAFTAVDGDSDPLWYSLLSGPGTIDSLTGLWTWDGATMADVGVPQTLVVRTCDPFDCGLECTVQIIVTNEAPVIGPYSDMLVGEGFPTSTTIHATDACNDPVTYAVISVIPPPGPSTFSIDPQTGVLTVIARLMNTYQVTIMASDGEMSDYCYLLVDVAGGCRYKFRIAGVEDVVPGHVCTVPISFYTYSEFGGLGSFDFLLSYPSEALLLQSASLGSAFGPDGCGWEYFTCRQATPPECTGDCPSGLIQLVGIAESNLVPGHPLCTLPQLTSLPTDILDLQFLVTNDQRLSCEHLPIRFFWRNCADNDLSSAAGDYQYLECDVADIQQPLWNYADPNVGFPTFKGAQSECDEWAGEGHPYPYRSVDFVNGAIDIACLDSVSDRGDLNLNGKPYEVADVVTYMEFFTNTWIPEVYPSPRQVAASDINGDGITLSVADLVQMIRIIMGYAYPIPKPNPVTAAWFVQHDELSIDGAMGAAYVVLKGEVNLQESDLLASGMRLGSRFDGANTRVLICPPFEGVSSIAGFSGPFLNTHGAEIVSIEAATPDGSPVNLSARRLPTAFALNQNYPNPFNPTTTITFALPVASDWTLTIANITGQQVAARTGFAQAGTTTLPIDASTWASGVYLYTLTAGSSSTTRKMTLLK
jgi:hypothetical protein